MASVAVWPGNLRRLDAGGPDIAVNHLRRIGPQRVIVQERTVCIPFQIIEAQVEVVIQAVGGNTRFFPRLLWIHLEGRGQVVCVADHRNRDVPHQYGTFQSFLFIKEPEFRPDGVRMVPAVHHAEASFADLLHGGDESVHVGGDGRIGDRIDHDGNDRRLSFS